MEIKQATENRKDVVNAVRNLPERILFTWDHPHLHTRSIIL